MGETNLMQAVVELGELLKLPYGRRPDRPRQGDHEVDGRVDKKGPAVAVSQDWSHRYHDPDVDVINLFFVVIQARQARLVWLNIITLCVKRLGFCLTGVILTHEGL